MEDNRFRIRFWGTRGSVPVSGSEYVRYGGNTACVEMQCGAHTLIFDAGSGIRPAGKAFIAAGVTDMDLFFTHCHYDHILGLPFFAPLYDPKVRLTAWSGHLAGRMTTRDMLRDFMRPPWFPVRLDICRANIIARDFVSGDVLRPRPEIEIRTGNLNHPGGCIGYRVEYSGRVVAVITDTEHVPGKLDEEILTLIADADLVIYDCTYIEEEMARFPGYGHSTWQQGIKLCEAAGAGRLALFHHDPMRTDTALETIEIKAREAFSGAFAAYDGLTLDL
jgi:ribonuclease Z